MRTPGDIRGYVVLATCREVVGAESTLSQVDGDMQMTIDALSDAGVEAQAAAWDDSSFDWASASAVVVRSTWDYHRRLEQFLQWIDAVSHSSRLENPPVVLRWNIDKRYLGELGRDGLPVIETLYIDPPVSRVVDERAQLAAIERLAQRGDIVVKPVVSAGSNDAQRHNDADSALSHIVGLVDQGRSVMVQPYLEQVDTESETGLVYIDGEFSHAFSKGPMLAAPGHAVGGLYLEERIDARMPTGEQRDLGDRVMAWLTQRWGRLLYARVDMLPSGAGPMIIEVELAEPSLYLHLDAGAPSRFADAICRRLADTESDRPGTAESGDA